MAYQYTYLLMGLVFLAIWLTLFVWKKNTRKEMVIMSFIFAFGGPLVDILYTKDWWHPLTITNTIIGPESFLVAFMIGGIASVIYKAVFKKKVKARKASKTKKAEENFRLLLILSILAIIFFVTFYLLKFNSLLSTIIALVVPSLVIWVKRKDLILDSLATGFLLVMVASLVYTVLDFLTPGWIRTFWYFKNVTDIIIFNVPLDDIILYFLAGIFIGPLYEYWQESRLIKSK